MPNLQKHCKNSEKRTGKSFEELHKWMDAPGKILETDHRRVRHDLSYIRDIRKHFGAKYGEAPAIREFLFHISDDYLDTAQKWGRPCATPGCKNDTWHKHKYCNFCLKRNRESK